VAVVKTRPGQLSCHLRPAAWRASSWASLGVAAGMVRLPVAVADHLHR
jgi:hypothetical protein